MKTIPVPLEQGQAACADPAHLPLVDAAHARPGGPEAQTMKATLCRHCPVLEQCAAWAMTHAEAGVWGGTSPGWRGKRGAPRGLTPVTHVRTDGVPAQTWRRTNPAVKRQNTPAARTRPASSIRCAELGVREGDVRRWAYEQGLARSNSGRPSLAYVEAWATAHQAP